MSKTRIKINLGYETIREAFESYLRASEAAGRADDTLKTYKEHFDCISKYLNVDMRITELMKSDTDEMVCSMRNSSLSYNSVCSYVRVFRAFLHWAQKEGYTDVEMKNMKSLETIKETYTDEELLKLLKKPKKNCSFCEFRNWVIVNFFVNSGCRAATLRNIQNKDVDLKNHQVVYRHTKTKNIQLVPLCDKMVTILREYMNIRRGEASDFLFCNEYGKMLTEGTLRLAIERYNNTRGVDKTSLHMFRHTFARKYLIDCGGDAFRLQKLLGHTTLDMTKHYCKIFDSDISENYNQFSPLENLSANKERIKK